MTEETSSQEHQKQAEESSIILPSDPEINIDDFLKVVLKTGKIISAEDHPNADKLLKLGVQIGEEQRTLCAGIKASWSPEDLIGKTVIVVTNLKPRKVRGIESQGMLLAVENPENGDVAPLTPTKEVPSGLRVH